MTTKKTPTCKHCGKEMTKIETTRKNYIADWFLSKPKEIFGIEYYRVACGSCFFERYKTLPAPPNIMDRNTMMFFLEVPTDVIDVVFSGRAVTKEKMIAKHGEEEGLRRWEVYRKKQSDSNTFEYKQEKYGWTKEVFDEYNKSRSQTLDNMILRYGATEGARRWEEYCSLQARSGITLEYFIEKYNGDVDAAKSRVEKIRKMKSNTYEGYVLRYGEKDASVLWQDYLSKKSSGCSKIANQLFSDLDNSLGCPDDIYFADKNFEFVVRRKGTKAHFLDFYFKSKNKVIEFFGDYWHMNPKIYSENDINRTTKFSAKEHWVGDSDRITFLTSCGFDVKIVWESEYRQNPKGVIEECIRYLES